MTAILLTGLLFGVAGSAHCAGMCGPLVLLARRGIWLHQLGRVTTYAVFGALAGMTGGVVTSGGLGPWLSIAAGLALAAAAVAHGMDRRPRLSIPGVRLVAAALVSSARWRARHRVGGALVGGGLNGLLPCGLVYAAVVAATPLGDPWTSAAFMAAFGAGTLPALGAVVWCGETLRTAAPTVFRRAAPVALVLMAGLLIARGLWPLYDPSPAHTHTTQEVARH
jgi:sulfite exporter TauE/SafE